MFAAVKSWFQDPKTRLLRVLGDAPLPTLRATALEVMQDLRDPEVPLGTSAGKIAMDPALSIGVLRMANSAAAGIRRRVDDVRHAAMLLGRSTLEAQILQIAVREALPSGAAQGFDPARFWRTAARRGAIAKELTNLVDPRSAWAAATAGVLQDLAIPVLAHRHQNYGPVLSRWHLDGGGLQTLEKSAFDWDHSDIGSWLCEEWKLPETLSEHIGGHHTPSSSPAPVSLVGFISERDDPEDLDRLVEAARGGFGVSADRVVAAVQRAEELLGTS